MRSTTIVDAFWDAVWNAHDPDAIDKFVTDDIVIAAGGQEITGKDNIKNWVTRFLDHVGDLHSSAAGSSRRHSSCTTTSSRTSGARSSGPAIDRVENNQ